MGSPGPPLRPINHIALAMMFSARPPTDCYAGTGSGEHEQEGLTRNSRGRGEDIREEAGIKGAGREGVGKEGAKWE